MNAGRGDLAAAARLLGDRARRDVPLGPLTTYRVGGAAALFVEATSADDLAAVADTVAATGVPTLVVGKGSNLLVADAGFPGVAIVLGEGFAAVEVAGTTVRAGAPPPFRSSPGARSARASPASSGRSGCRGRSAVRCA